MGAAAIFFGAATWGLFWIPMRYFDGEGLTALWAVAAINLGASLIAVPVALWRGEIERANLRWLAIIGIGMGLSNVLYFAALILSDVIRVTFLFYLLPIWATIFSKVLFNVAITGSKLIAVLLAFAGIWLLLGGGGWPIPQNIGDVFGLFSGMGWAFGLTMIRGRGDLGGFATTASAHCFAFIAAVLIGLTLSLTLKDVQPSLPDMGTLLPLVLPVLAFSILILWPTNVGQLWGARYVASTTAALLTMSEIVVATLSYSLFGEANLTLLGWFGGGLIVCAIFVDLFARNDA